MTNKLSYWKLRLLQIAVDRDKKDQKYIREMNRRYDDLSDSIYKKIQEWVGRYADNEGISKDEAYQLLSKDERRNWKMTLSQFREKAIDGGYEQELNEEYYRSRISRLEHLERQLYFELAEAAKQEEEHIQAHLKEQLHESYLRAIYELTDRGSFLLPFDRYNSRALAIAISNPWKGSNFSSRIWKNHLETIPDKLSKVMSQAIVQGWGIDRSVNEMMYGVDKSLRNRMITLVQTESAHVAEVANEKAMEETGVKKWEWLATLEIHTCARCASLDGQEFDVGDANAPSCPDHPNCRCTKIPVIVGWSSSKRWQRDPITGKGSIKDYQTFDEWKKDNVTPDVEKQLKIERNRTADKRQFERYQLLLGKSNMPRKFDKFVEMKYNNPIEYEQILRKTRLQRSIDSGVLSLNINADKQQRHEFGHPSYEVYVRTNASKGLPTPSYTTIGVDKLQELLNANYLKGKVIERNNGQVAVEFEINRFDYAVAFSRDGINKKETNRFKAHISKKATHIVPMYPKE